jgi:hypothetical protein
VKYPPYVMDFGAPVVGGMRRAKGYKPVDPDDSSRRWKELERRSRDMDGVKILPFEAAADRGLSVIPESDWDDYIREAEKNNATNMELMLGSGAEVLDQKQTNYCWIFAVGTIMMLSRLQEGARHPDGRVIRPSPASAGAPITQFRNVGGWSSNGLEYVAQYGMNDEEEWPPTAISRTYYTDENKQKALKNRAIEVYYMAPNNKSQRWLETGTALSAGFGTASGYNHWSHAIGLMQLTLGTHDVVLANSWSPGWGDRGYGTLSKSSGKAQPDDSCMVWTLETR